jgi:phage shock protein A
MKASCAGAIAARKKSGRAFREADTRAADWNAKAELAVSKGREDLAREALLEKRRYADTLVALEKEAQQLDDVVGQYQSDMLQLEDKLTKAREKQRALVQRHIHAQKKSIAQQQIRHAGSGDAVLRFEQFENRIERMEAEADLVNVARKPSLEDQFTKLVTDEEIEKELAAIKAKASTPSH